MLQFYSFLFTLYTVEQYYNAIPRGKIRYTDLLTKQAP